jgi:hypothetical protein
MVGLHNPVTTISICISSSSLSRLALNDIQPVLVAAKINTQRINNKPTTAFNSQSHTSTNLYVSVTASHTPNSHFAWRRDDRFLYTRLPAEWEIVPDPHSRRQHRVKAIPAKYRHRRIRHCGLIHVRGALKARVNHSSLI